MSRRKIKHYNGRRAASGPGISWSDSFLLNRGSRAKHAWPHTMRVKKSESLRGKKSGAVPIPIDYRTVKGSVTPSPSSTEGTHGDPMSGPKFTTSQRIGGLGRRVFIGNHPDSWVQESEPLQGGDFGFDISMWLTGLGEVAGRFSVQLKTGVDVELRGDTDPYFSVPLTKAACDLYFQDGQPVMLVLVVLRDETMDGARMYYVWITDEIAKRLGNRLEFGDEDPNELTFRVPAANELLKSVDLSAYLENYWTVTRIAGSFRSEHGQAALKAVSKLSPEGMSVLGDLSSPSLDRWLTHEALDGETLWATPKSESVVAKLKSISDDIAHGNIESARQSIADLGGPAQYDSDVAAELHYQSGRMAHLDGNIEAALEHFAAAAQARPGSENYFIAHIEADFVIKAGRGESDFDETFSRSQTFGSSQTVKFQLLRIHAYCGRRAEAEQLLSELEGATRREALVLCHSAFQDWASAVEAAQVGLAAAPDGKHRRLLILLKARALLGLVVGRVEGIRVGGRPDLDVAHAEQLRETTVLALREARLAGCHRPA